MSALIPATQAFKLGRFGLGVDPTGAQVMVRQPLGCRALLLDVVGVFYRELPSAFMLRTRHFNGEPGPDVPLSVAYVLMRRP